MRSTGAGGRARRYAGGAARVALVAGCVGYLLWGLDLARLGDVLARYGALPVTAMLLASLAAYACLGLRLRVLVGPALGFPHGLAAALLSLGLNNVLPARLGEIAKVLYLRERAGEQTGAMLGVVFWERFSDVNALVAIGLATLLLVELEVPVWPLAAAAAAVWAIVLSARWWWPLAERGLRRIPAGRAAGLALDFGTFLRRGLSRPVLAGLAAATAATWAFYAAEALLGLLWAAGLPLGFGEALAVFVVAVIGMAAPGAPGGLGVFEAAMVIALGWFGVAKEEALGVGLVLRAVNFVPTTLAAAAILARSGLSLRALSRPARPT